MVNGDKLVITTTAADYALDDTTWTLRVFVSGTADPAQSYTPADLTLIINWVHPCRSAALTEAGWAGLSKQLNEAVANGATDSASFDVFPFAPGLPAGLDCGPQNVEVTTDGSPLGPECIAPRLQDLNVYVVGNYYEGGYLAPYLSTFGS